MKAENINTFYKSTKTLFTMMLDLNLKRGQLKLCEEVEDDDHIGILVEIDGRLEGHLYYIIPKEVAINMAEHMVGVTVEELDEFVIQILVEVVNKITELTELSLEEKKKKCKISEPEIITEDLNKIFKKDENFISVPMESEIGSFYMNIVLKSNLRRLFSF